MKKLGSIKNGEKNIFPLITTRPRTMTFAEYQLLTPEQKQGEIIISDYPVPVEGDYVEVTADGVKTYATLLNELFAKIDFTKITQHSILVQSASGYIFPYNLVQAGSDTLSFEKTRTVSSNTISEGIIIESSTSRLYVDTISASGVSIRVATNDTPTSGTKFTLYYNSTKTLELGTLAQNCMMSDGVTSVEDKLDDLKTIDVSNSVTIDSTNVSEGAILAKYCKTTNLLTLVTTTRIKSTNAVTSYGEVTIANIALPYRPTYAVRVPVYSATGGNDGISMLYVETDGNVKLVNIGSSSTSFYARFNTSFLLS